MLRTKNKLLLCFSISFTGYVWKIKTHSFIYIYTANDTSLLNLISNVPSVHYRSWHFKIPCDFDLDFVTFSIRGVKKALTHLLNFALQRHNDVTFATYKTVAKTEEKAVTWIYDEIWKPRIGVEEPKIL